MSDEVSTASQNDITDTAGKSLTDSKERPIYFQVMITLGLILGPIYLPLVWFWPNTFEFFPAAFEISLGVTIIFITSSVIFAYLKSK
jgi:hypothetical protein